VPSPSFKRSAHCIGHRFVFQCAGTYITTLVQSKKVRPYIRSKHAQYVSSLEEHDKSADGLDLAPCPHCRVIGCLNRHGSRSRFDERTRQDAVCEARVYCNNRGKMKGCGRTYPVVLIERMAGYIVTCTTLWAFLLILLQGNTIKDSWKPATTRFCPDTGYKLRQAFIRSQSHIRTLLSKLGPPGGLHGATDPVLQTIQQVRYAFSGSSCPISAFQLRFQKPFLI
jgi:hypothetical protein